jgi:hypothetical protein
MTTFNLIAKQDYLEKVARTRDPIRAISEFVWNALDADATQISVAFTVNVLGGIEEIIICDNEIGINHVHAERDFGNLGDSWKRTTQRSPKLQRALHGKEGRGRLRFFSLAENCRIAQHAWAAHQRQSVPMRETREIFDGYRHITAHRYPVEIALAQQRRNRVIDDSIVETVTGDTDASIGQRADGHGGAGCEGSTEKSDVPPPKSPTSTLSQRF